MDSIASGVTFMVIGGGGYRLVVRARGERDGRILDPGHTRCDVEGAVSYREKFCPNAMKETVVAYGILYEKQVVSFSGRLTG